MTSPSAAGDVSDDPLWRALLLVLTAGFVDAVGFLALGGTFVAFMSGNTSAAGAFAGTGGVAKALVQLVPLPCFVAGIYLGALAVQSAPPAAQRRRYAVVLAVEWALMAIALGAARLWGIRGAVPLDPPQAFFGLAALLAVAMGLQNAMRVDIRGAHLATTYVTGTLHVAAQSLARATVLARAAGALRRGAPSSTPGPGAASAEDGRAAAQARRAGMTGLTVWAGFLVGAIGGGALFARAGLMALVVPLLLLPVLMVDAMRGPARRARP